MSKATGVVQFSEAIGHAKDTHDSVAVLLGNGFSIDFDPVFSYDSLAEKADLARLHCDSESLFTSLDSPSFELAIERLRRAARIISLYEDDPEISDLLHADAEVIRHALPTALAELHPQKSTVVDPKLYASAQDFLSHFSEYFTLNYDILLYWTLMSSGHRPFRRDDGFRGANGDLAWQRTPAQNVHYLHGALHLFQELDGTLRKLSYSRDGALVNAVKNRIEADEFPLFVSEGTCTAKAEFVERHPYLREAHRRLRAGRGALFLHGVSLSEHDDHIFELIEDPDCDIETLYVGIHGSPRKRSTRHTRQRANLISERRRENGGRDLDVRFYDSASANVWRD